MSQEGTITIELDIPLFPRIVRIDVPIVEDLT